MQFFAFLMIGGLFISAAVADPFLYDLRAQDGGHFELVADFTAKSFSYSTCLEPGGVTQVPNCILSVSSVPPPVPGLTTNGLTFIVDSFDPFETNLNTFLYLRFPKCLDQ